MSGGHRTLAAVTAAALLAVSAGSARADGAPDAATKKARAHFDRGKELFGLGEYEAAIHEFEAAERIKPAGANHYNMAQAYEKLGDIPSAIASYTLYLDALPDAHDREIIDGKISTLKAVLRTAPTVGYVRVDLAEAGTEVVVDGESRGRTPLATVLELEAGKHVVRLQKRGFISWEGTITVAAGDSTVLAASLVAEGGERGSRAGAWVVTGLAGGALLVGLSLGGGALAANGGFVHDGPQNLVAMRLALAADVAYAVGGALAVTAITVWIATAVLGSGSKRGRDSAGASPPVRASVVPLLAPGLGGGALILSY